MKHEISFRLLFTLVFSLTAIFALRVEAQSIKKNKSSFTWDLGLGYGSFKGLTPYEVTIESGTFGTSVPGTDRFTDLAMACRLLLPTGLLDSRFNIGVEWNLQKIRKGEVSEMVEYVGGGDVIGPDKVIHSVLLIGDYFVTEISDNVCINAGGGLGALFFVNINTRMEHDQNTGMLTESDESTVQFAASGRLHMPIRVRSSFTIDPEIRLLTSTGQEKVFNFQFLVGLSYRW